ncbi:MAG: MmcQ/YjbR family DNA-binding protein [Clostridia bacterium]|nr:MmcQ/YjbR family DNA-binding protein [Clostridia bacterium]
MTRQQILDYADTITGASCDYPWEGDFTSCVIRHTESKKWFGLLFEASGKSLLKGLEEDKRRLVEPYAGGNSQVDILNLKCDPALSVIIQHSFAGVIPAYHMNKTHWITIILQSDVPEKDIKMLIDMSFELTKK